MLRSRPGDNSDTACRNITLYQHLLGETFDQLPECLRRFHASISGGTAHGEIRVTRGKGVIRRLLATVMGLPPEGERVALHLEVRTVGDEEIWVRHFDSRPLTTRQSRQSGLLLEKAGPMCFCFRVLAIENGIHFVFDHCRLLGVALPLWLSPRVEAWATGCEQGWRINVSVEVPVVGFLTRYEGGVTPEC